MIALGIIILILILILLLRVGVDAAYSMEVFSLAVKIGPFSKKLLPASPQSESEDKKEKKPKKQKNQKKDKPAPESGDKKKSKKLKFGLKDILGIVKIGLKTLAHFWRKISIDHLKLHFIFGGSDPYDTVMSYGYFNAGVGALLPLLHKVFNIKDEDYNAEIDFGAEKTKIDLRVCATIRIGEILLVVFCALYAVIRWYLPIHRRNKAKSKEAGGRGKTNEKITENSSAEKGT